MRKFLLYSSALAVLSGTAGAACIQTPSCSSLGYESSTSCEGGIKCPFGNAWNCTLINKITELEKIIEKNQSEEILKNCKIGDILYDDMTCNTNMVASKTPIGVVFDITNGLAIAKDEFSIPALSTVNEDLPGITNYNDISKAETDWQGFNNTKAMYEADKTGAQYPVAKKVLTYTTTGTTQGQWYLPAMGELKAIMENIDTLNATLSKLAATQISTYTSDYYWSSTEYNDSMVYYKTASSGSYLSKAKGTYLYVRPVINFVSKNKINVAYTAGGSETSCKIGSILYSDKKCYSGELQSNKTPIGIVFNPDKRLAAALDYEQGTNWGPTDVDVPNLTNYTDSDKALQDFNGKSNTAAIIAYAKSSGKSYPAAEFAYNYKTSGTQAGDWYLPSIGELNQIYIYKEVLGYTKAIINSYQYGNLNIAGSSSSWSSSEVNTSNAWNKSFSDYKSDSKSKIEAYSSTLPVLAY